MRLPSRTGKLLKTDWLPIIVRANGNCLDERVELYLLVAGVLFVNLVELLVPHGMDSEEL